MNARREIVLGVTGGIAAYKSADLCSKLVQADYGVTVVLTETASRFIGAATFEALTGRPVHRDMFTPEAGYQRGTHIELARQAALIVVAPATADFMAKLAHGLADDLLSTLGLAATSPILLAPAMNCEMWSKPAVQRNIAQLQADGCHFVEPGAGWLSCGQVGTGRMAEPAEILSAIQRLLAPTVC